MASDPNLLMNMFGRPRGIIGQLGGVIMARMNADCGVRVAGLLEVTPDDAVLEIGFGPGVISIVIAARRRDFREGQD